MSSQEVVTAREDFEELLSKAEDLYRLYYRLKICSKCNQQDRRGCVEHEGDKFCDHLTNARVRYFREEIEYSLMSRWVSFKIGLGKQLTGHEVFSCDAYGIEDRLKSKIQKLQNYIATRRGGARR